MNLVRFLEFRTLIKFQNWKNFSELQIFKKFSHMVKILKRKKFRKFNKIPIFHIFKTRQSGKISNTVLYFIKLYLLLFGNYKLF